MSGLSILRLLPVLSFLVDAVALGAILATGQIQLETFVIIGVISVLALARRVSTQLLVPLMLSVIAACVVVLFKFRIHPLIVVAHGVILIQALLWLPEATVRSRFLRVALGLIEIAVAASLTPEVYVAFAIFTFVFLSSLLLSALFLTSEWQSRCPGELSKPLPTGFVTFSGITSLLVLAFSLLIFPFLPRLQSSFRSPFAPFSKNSQSQAGYSDRVDLRSAPIWSSETNQTVALRIFLPEGLLGSEEAPAFRAFIPGGLIRGQILNRFQSGRWSHSGAKFIKPVPLSPPEASDFEWIREPMETDLIFSTYASQRVGMAAGSPEKVSLIQMKGESWTLPGSQGRRVRYRVSSQSGGKVLNEPPDFLDLGLEGVDLILSETKWRELSKKLGLDRGPLSSRLAALSNYFTQEGFQGAMKTVPSSQEGQPGQEGKTRKVPLLDRFLFEFKAGHCEWFASSAAVLLRMAGVPARLVNGFRVTRLPVGGVQTIRQSDAHVWVEAWDRQQKVWRHFDPTPIVTILERDYYREFLSRLSIWSDTLSAYWFKYVLTYDGPGSLHMEGRDESLGAFAGKTLRSGFGLGDSKIWVWLGTAFFIFLGVVILYQRMSSGESSLGVRPDRIFWFGRNSHWSYRSFALIWRTIRFNWLSARTRLSPERLSALLSEWREIRDRIRFGPVEKGSAEFQSTLRALDRVLQQISEEVT